MSSSSSSVTKDRQWLSKLVGKTEQDDGIFVVAPMVDASDLPFRLQCRRYGFQLCVTPMIHATLYCTQVRYRQAFEPILLAKEDTPLIAQLCGSNIETMVQAATQIAPLVQGIDVNCGCPQGIAKRGMYGAFLLEQEDLLLSLITKLRQALPSTKLSVKVRLLPSGNMEDSINLYRKLVHAGIDLLTVHGRDRHNKGHLTTRADWNAIQQVVQELGFQIPILANGSICTKQDALQCIQHTGADGVMISEAVLENPAMLLNDTPRPPSRLELAQEYLTLATTYPPHVHGQGSGIKCVRAHLHRMTFPYIKSNVYLRDLLLVKAKSMEDFQLCLEEMKQQQPHALLHHEEWDPEYSWYMRYRSNSVSLHTNDDDKKKKESSSTLEEEEEETNEEQEEEEEAYECSRALFQ